jgi:aminodeoxyfutalosine synthase
MAGSPGGYFQTIIPLPFIPDGSEMEHLPGPRGIENLPHARDRQADARQLPARQGVLDHADARDGPDSCSAGGADDIDGTVVWYDITKVGGASTHQEVTVVDLQRRSARRGSSPWSGTRCTSAWIARRRTSSRWPS